MFEKCLGAVERPAGLVSVRANAGGADMAGRTADRSVSGSPGMARVDAGALGPLADPDAIPVLEPLAGLLPGGLRRGEAAVLADRNQGPDYLTLALLAGALNAGLWCAVVGVPQLGVAALTGMLGADPAARRAALDRLLLVPEPGEQWAEVLATLADGVDLLLARPATPVRTEVARRIDARLRQGRSAGTRHSAALLVLGAGWPSARLMLRTAHTDWTGLDGIGPTAGTGHLTGGRATVVAEGRATAGRPRVARVWLPDETGSVRSLSDDPRIRAGTGPGTGPGRVPRGADRPAAIPAIPAAAGPPPPAPAAPPTAA
jgi:hypothetical protein